MGKKYCAAPISGLGTIGAGWGLYIKHPDMLADLCHYNQLSHQPRSYKQMFN